MIRLINTEDLCLTLFIGEEIPKYAILSHTWEHDGELVFQDMMVINQDQGHPAVKKPGYVKLFNLCKRARADGIPYAWIDSSCIDKTSSSELSEAINAMYRWYQRADVCYALLSDFDTRSTIPKTALPGCRWFTRGWCLQELLAPQNVVFFDAHWRYIGSKADLKDLISKITRIDEQILVDNSLISSVPVARRMSWASGRKTTREEDIAYCLLGLFDVNLPLLYGEGPKAFIRLQEEIIRNSNDLSIFAFPGRSASLDLSKRFCDLFALSPNDFRSCENLVHIETNIYRNNAFALTNKGLYFQRAQLLVNTRQHSYSMLLNCKLSESKSAAIHLQKVGPGLFARYCENGFADNVRGMDIDYNECYYAEIEEVYIITKLSPPRQLKLERADDYAICIWSHSHSISRAIQVLQRSSSSNYWDASRMMFFTKGERSFRGYCKVFPNLMQRTVEMNDGYQPLTGHFYLICGLEHPENHSKPTVWVRLYSSEEWNELTKKFGIITNLDDVTGFGNISGARDRMRLGKIPTGWTTITATIKLEIRDGWPRFELELDFEHTDAAETPHNAATSTDMNNCSHIRPANSS